MGSKKKPIVIHDDDWFLSSHRFKNETQHESHCGEYKITGADRLKNNYKKERNQVADRHTRSSATSCWFHKQINIHRQTKNEHAHATASSKYFKRLLIKRLLFLLFVFNKPQVGLMNFLLIHTSSQSSYLILFSQHSRFKSNRISKLNGLQ